MEYAGVLLYLIFVVATCCIYEFINMLHFILIFGGKNFSFLKESLRFLIAFDVLVTKFLEKN